MQANAICRPMTDLNIYLRAEQLRITREASGSRNLQEGCTKWNYWTITENEKDKWTPLKPYSHKQEDEDLSREHKKERETSYCHARHVNWFSNYNFLSRPISENMPTFTKSQSFMTISSVVKTLFSIKVGTGKTNPNPLATPGRIDNGQNKRNKRQQWKYDSILTPTYYFLLLLLTTRSDEKLD